MSTAEPTSLNSLKYYRIKTCEIMLNNLETTKRMINSIMRKKKLYGIPSSVTMNFESSQNKTFDQPLHFKPKKTVKKKGKDSNKKGREATKFTKIYLQVPRNSYQFLELKNNKKRSMFTIKGNFTPAVGRYSPKFDSVERRAPCFVGNWGKQMERKRQKDGKNRTLKEDEKKLVYNGVHICRRFLSKERNKIPRKLRIIRSEIPHDVKSPENGKVPQKAPEKEIVPLETLQNRFTEKLNNNSKFAIKHKIINKKYIIVPEKKNCVRIHSIKQTPFETCINPVQSIRRFSKQLASQRNILTPQPSSALSIGLGNVESSRRILKKHVPQVIFKNTKSRDSNIFDLTKVRSI
ncbi:unnamed protein product [Moneuplotes crassus]|uniref:Uncharacterized protein n=1 Tax=Euplotes crassus TaxID=5936 RepID=A0AAD1X5P7_EUPCR|nr:unnamed protein product [Moneuplotes crassus]